MSTITAPKNIWSEPGPQSEWPFIPLSVPQIAGNEWCYVKECLDSGWVSSVGPFVERFEQSLATEVGSRYAVAAVSGTAALHLALSVAGVQTGDEVLVSTLSFIAPANAVRYVGAWPVFIDAEPDYWQMDPEKVKSFLEKQCNFRNGKLHNEATGRRIKAILPVHVLGHPCEMDPLLQLARKYDLAVIEDATESLGAGYKERKTGHLGDVACFSFNGNKILTTGGGGMMVTDSEAWARRARYLSTQAKDDPVEFIHGEVGYNYRLTSLQAAMGCAQVEMLAHAIRAKRRIAQTYTEAFRSLPGVTPMREARWAFSTFWLYTILLDEAVCGVSSRTLLRHLENARIQSRPLWQPLHLSPAHKRGHQDELPVAERLNREALSLPCSVGLATQEQQRVVDVVLDTLRKAKPRRLRARENE